MFSQGTNPFARQMEERKKKIQQNLSKIKYKIAVMSGKGGVGKTTVAVNIAALLSKKGKTGILDADIDCPNVNKFLGINERLPMEGEKTIVPIEKLGLKVVSMASLQEAEDTAIMWRGPLIANTLAQFLENTKWGELDYLIFDAPPGCLSSEVTIFGSPQIKPIIDINQFSNIYSVDASLSKESKKWVFNGKLIKSNVKRVLSTGIAPLLRLKTKIRSVLCTTNHPILVVEKSNSARGAKRLAWKKAGQIKAGDIAVILKKLPDEGKAFDLPKLESKSKKPIKVISKTTEDFLRVIGFFIGDGYVRLNGKDRFLGVWFAEPDNGKYRKKYENLLSMLFNANIFTQKKEFAILSNVVCELFVKLGLHKKALEKRVPDWIFALPYPQIESFIEGYCDADGHRRISKSGHRRAGWLNFESPNMLLLSDVRNLCIMIGWHVTNLNNRTRTNVLPSGKKITSVFWGFEANKQNANNRFGANLIRGRIIGKGLENDYLGFSKILKIEDAGEGETFDLQLEENHNFIANGFIVHNTSDVALSLMQNVDISGIIVVSTPQEVALTDARKAMNMAKQFGVKILGLVENMSGDMFGKGTVEQLAKQTGETFLGRISLDKKLREITEQGKIPAVENSKIRKEFEKITENIQKRL